MFEGYVCIGHGCVEVFVIVEVFGLLGCGNILYDVGWDGDDNVRVIMFDGGGGVSLWFSMTMVVVILSSLATIPAQWIASMEDLWSTWWTSTTPCHFAKFESHDEPKIFSMLCAKWTII